MIYRDRPGDRGTKKLTKRYRDKLVAVRYRYDSAKGKRYTTVELIVEEAPWIGRPKTGSDVFIRVGWDQKDLKNRIKEAGGEYYSNRKLWKIPYETAKNLGITKLKVNNA